MVNQFSGKKIRAVSLILLFVLFIFAGCASTGKMDTKKCPFSVLGIRLAMDESPEYFGGKAVFLKVKNDSRKTIKTVNVVFVFEKNEDELPLKGGNELRLEFNYSLEAGAVMDAGFHLEDYLSESGKENLVLEETFISRILYEDNSFWTDYFGKHSIQGELY